ncbi:MAG TPA: porin [Burkholderiaceae bacterium]|nr:porin [Burkholderiaceae bacterium]
MKLFQTDTHDVRVRAKRWSLLALWSAAAVCHAQSAQPYTSSDTETAPVVLQPYGIIDAGVRHIQKSSPAGELTQFASGLNTSRIGLRGSDAIAPDLQAVFRLESGFNSGNGNAANSTSLIDRTADVGFRGGSWEFLAGRMEGFGYELAASGATDPLRTALNLPNYSSPPAANSKAPVLGANPLQAVYSYTYGQLRFNNALRFSVYRQNWSAGAIYAFGGVAGEFSADSVRAGHLGWHARSAQLDAVVQQSLDVNSNRSTLYVFSGAWTLSAWQLQAGFHQIRIDAGFNSATLGNGASSSGILGNSTTVSPILASPTENFRFQVADLGVTWTVAEGRLITLAAYKSETQGAGQGENLALVALGKWFLNKRVALYLEADHANSSGRLAVEPVSTSPLATAFMTGINVHF